MDKPTIVEHLAYCGRHARRLSNLSWKDTAALASYVSTLENQIAICRAHALKDAAEQFRVVACPLISNGRTVKPESCDKCAKMLGPEYCTEVAAIMNAGKE